MPVVSWVGRLLGVLVACGVMQERWNPPLCLPMGCSIPPLRAKQISGHLAIGPGASSSMIFGLLGVLAVDRGRHRT